MCYLKMSETKKYKNYTIVIIQFTDFVDKRAFFRNQQCRCIKNAL